MPVNHQDTRERFLLAAGLVALSALLALIGLAVGDYAVLFVLVPALLTAGVTFVYSHVVYRRVGTESSVGPGN